MGRVKRGKGRTTCASCGSFGSGVDNRLCLYVLRSVLSSVSSTELRRLSERRTVKLDMSVK